jgi:hypothetical protein
MELFKGMCSEALEGLPTTVQDDVSQLAAVPEYQERLRLALTWRLGYKQ